MRYSFRLICIAALVGASSAAFAAPVGNSPAPSFANGARHCQTPPGAETLLPLECACHNHPLSQAQQKEYARLSQVPSANLTRYDRGHIFQLNRQINPPFPGCATAIQTAAPAEAGDHHAPALPVLDRPHPVLKRSIITPPPRLPPSSP